MAKNRIGFGSDIVLNNNNVGLGTTNPTEKLHVIGNIKATGTVSAASDLVVTKGKAIKFSNPVNEQTVDVLSDASLYVTGISTFSEGPLIIGSGTSTGTSTQRLQVTGGAYVSDNIGIGITKPTYKLDILGTQDPNKWVRQYFEGTYTESQLENISRDEYISATAVDSLGNIYVSGGSWDSISPYEQKGYLLKLSPSGDLIWQLDFTNVDPSQDSLVADALHIDSSDNIYLGINVEDSIDAIVLKLNTSGSILWQRYINIQFLSSIITDSSGAVYVGGSRNNLLGWIGKLSASTGLIEWQREINTGSGTTRGFGLLGVDSANNVYWSGSYITNSYYNGYIVKINSSGTVQWQKDLGGAVSRAAERITHIKVDSADNVYLLVTFETHSSVFPFTESYFIGLIKLNTSGTEIWQKQIGIDSDKAKSYSLSFDSTNNIYLVGEHFSQQNTNILIVKLDSSANIIWQKSFGIDGVEYSEGGWWNNGHTNIVVNNSNLIVSGYTNYVHQYDWALNAIIAKFTIDGNFNGNYGDFVVRDSNLSIGSTSRPISGSSFSISTSSATETAAGLGTTVATRTFKIEDVPTLNATGGRSFLEKLKSTDVNVSGEFVLNGIPFTNTESSDHNVAIGVGAGSSLSGGYNNFFVGKDAGRLTVNGCYNNFFGMCAGRSNVDGSYNNFFGKYAGYCLVSSGYNNFFGPAAGKYTTTGWSNNFIGYYSGWGNTTGSYNTFFGFVSGYCNTTGSYNNFFGCESGYNNTTGSYNNFYGNGPGFYNTTGCYNNFFGNQAGLLNTSGCGNNYFGGESGKCNTTGSYNNSYGTSSGYCNITGSLNNYFGSFSGISTAASFKVIIGSANALQYPFDAPNPNKDVQFAIGVRTDVNPSKYWLVGDENFNIGIGTTNPTSKLYVSGGAYVSGNLGIGTTSPSYRLDILGTQDPNKWVRQYFEGTYESSQIEYSLNELVGATAVDSLGNIYVSGAANNNSGPGDNAYLLKLSPSGDLIWQLDFTTAADPYVYGDVLHIDSSDNIYLGINLVNAIDAAVLKLNTSGEIIWQRIIDIQFLSSVITDSFGDVYVSGSRNNFNGWLGKLSPSDGSIVWQRDTTTGSVTTRGYGIVGIDTSNNLYISGSYISGSWFDAYIQKYNSSGTIQWQKVLNGINSRSDYALQMGVDSSNNVYFLGYTTNTSNQTNIILVKFDTSGNVIWQKYIGDYSDDVSAYSLSFDSSNNIYIFGANNKDVPTESDILLFKLNSSGDSIWQKRFGGEGYPKYQELAWIYVNSGHKHIIVNGQDLIVSAQSSNMYYGYQNQLNVLIAKFSTDGNFNGKYGDFVVEDVNLGIGSTSYTIITSSFTVSTGIQTSSASGFTTSVTVRTLKEEESTILNSIGGRSFLEIINSERINVNGEFVLNGIPFTQTNIVTNTQSGTSHNVAIGVGAGSSLSAGFGYNNFFVGLGAGKSTVGGGSNVFLGKYAGCSNIDGWANNFIGSCAGLCNQDGVSNNFFGYDAGYYNTTGDRNNFFGERAGYYNTTGNYNNFFGWDSGCDNTTGSYNNFFGTSSGRNNTTGSGNNFFGRYAGTTNTTGCGNNFFGRYAGNLNNSGSNNNFFGRDAGFSNTTGSCNNFIGFEAGDLNQTGNFNVVIGSLRNTPIRNGSNQLVIGAGSTDWIVGTSSYNVGIGTTTPTSKLTVVGDITATGRIISTSGVEVSQGRKIKFGAVEVISDAELLISGISTFTNGPVLIGSGTSTGTSSQRLQVTGGAYVSGNLGIGTTNPKTKLQVGGIIGFNDTNVRIGGTDTGASITSGCYNNFIGPGAGRSTTNGLNNNFFGRAAGYSSINASDNNFFGFFAGYRSINSFANNFLGYEAGYYTTSGDYNNFLGYQAGYNSTSARGNNFFGRQAGYNNTTGCYNVFFNAYAGYSNTTGDYNNFLGWGAGKNSTTGHDNNFIGFYAAACNTTGSVNNLVGMWAGYYNTTGFCNNAFGVQAGNCNSTGNNNIFLGNYTGVHTNTSYRVVIGEGQCATVAFDVPKNANKQFAVGLNTTGNSEYWIVGDENFNIGIGTTNPISKLTIDGVLSFAKENTVIDSENLNIIASTGVPAGFAGTDSGSFPVGAGYTISVGLSTFPTAPEFFSTYLVKGLNGNLNGKDASFSVSRWNPAPRFGGVYNVVVDNYGYDFVVGEVITIPGTSIGGTSPGNDVKVYINEVGPSRSHNIVIGKDAAVGFGSTTFYGNYNTVIGFEAGKCSNNSMDHTFPNWWDGAGSNVLIGPKSGYYNQSYNNVFIGNKVGYSNTTGYENIFLGSCAGYYNSTGCGNNFIGLNAGYNNTTGHYNNFFGYAGYYSGNTTGSYNNFLGYYSGQCNTTGSYNNFFGTSAGYNNTTGKCNNFLGYYSGCSNQTGCSNNFFGEYSGMNNTTGNYNVFLGSNAGVDNTTQSYKIILGGGRGAFDTLNSTNDTQLAIGIATISNFTSVKRYWLSGNQHFNISIDGPALTLDRSSGEDRIYIGRQSGTGWNPDPTEVGYQYGQIVLGAESGIGLTTLTQNSNGNIIIGNYSGKNITGDENTFLGNYSAYLSCELSGDWNTSVGNFSGNRLTTGRSNALFGRAVGNYLTTGSYNSFFGQYSGNDTTVGGYNSFFGYLSGFCNTTGIVNSFFGSEAGRKNLTGCSNTFLGNAVGYANTFGSYNIFVGSYSGISTRSSYKIIIGSGAGVGGNNHYFDSPFTNKDTQFAVGVRTDVNPSKYWLVGDENFNVGIGTTNPTSKLTVGGDITATGRIISTSGVEVAQGKKIKFGAVEVISDAELLISGISTFTNGPVLIGSGTSTGTSTQRLQVTGGAYVSGNLGIGTTNPTTALTISGVVGFTTSNVRIGDNTTGNSTITGSNNVFIGRYAGTAVTTGRNNNFFGGCAGRHHTSGIYNNFFGLKAGYCNTIGSNNNFFGLESGYSNVNGYSNNFFGIQAGFSNTNGVYNNFFGAFAGIDNTTGYHNNFIGWSAGDFNTTGIENTFIGYLAGRCNTTGSHNNFFGTTAGAGHTTGCYNNFIGYSAGGTAKGGCNNNFFGTNNGCSNTTGSNNNFFGTNAGNGNTTGSCNNFIGYRAGIGITSGICNNYVGNDSGSNGSYNNALGTGTGGGGCYNNFIGNYTGTFNTTGCYNNFFGYIAGDFNTTGVYNNFFGAFAGDTNTTGSYNNFFGKFAGDYNSTGSYNTFLGNYTGLSTSSSYKVIVGTGYSSLSIFDAPDTTKDTQLAIGINTTGISEYWLVGNENFNIGIGTTNPISKLTVEGNALVSGFVTATTFIGQVDAGVGTITTLNSTSATITNLSGTNISYSGVSTFIDGPVFIGSGSSTAPSQPLQVIGDTYISGNLGIGTTNPTSKLSVEGGDIRVGVNTSHGVILTSPNGTQYRLIVDDSGVLSTAPV